MTNDNYTVFSFSRIMHSFLLFFFFKQKTAYEMRISDWSSDVCSSDLTVGSLIGGAFGSPFGGAALPSIGNIPVLGSLFGGGASAGAAEAAALGLRSEERRVGKECVSTCRYRGSPEHTKKHKKITNINTHTLTQAIHPHMNYNTQ